MTPAQAAAIVAVLSDDPRLVRVARAQLNAAAAAEASNHHAEAQPV